MGFRFYVCTDEGLRRIAREVFENRASLPQFANTGKGLLKQLRSVVTGGCSPGLTGPIPNLTPMVASVFHSRRC